MRDRLELNGILSERPTIVITGFMGTGKTTVGKTLSEMLALDFVDTDAGIEESAGCSISRIFDTLGEAHFRNLERAFCLSLEGRRGVVIATGGGTLLDEATFDLFSRMGQLVLLEASADVLSLRIARSGVRPLLAMKHDGDSSDRLEHRIETLLMERSYVYDRIPLKIDTSRLEPIGAAARIVSALQIPCHSMEVTFAPRTARIDIGRGVLSKLGERLKTFGIGARAFLLMTEKIRDTYLPQIAASLEREEIPFSVVTIDDAESRKNLAQAEEIIDRLIVQGARRDATIIPVGGGVTGDLGGFVASIYMRGVPLVHVPTTLLSQVDSSVGGKVGVNHTLAKNLVGSFYQPHVVLIDPCVLRTLPIEETANGMAEVVKTALIGSVPLFLYLESQMRDDPETRLRDIGFLETCVRSSARIKACIVNEDPYEKNLRRTLNLGHTVGHAIESSARYRGFKHGQAVSVGMVTAFQIAVTRGLIEKSLLDRVSSLLLRCRLPVTLESFDEGSVRESVRLDKKIKRDRIHYVLPTGLGEAIVVDDVSEKEILTALEKGAS